MKKILSLVMALAMVLGCFAMAETTSILDADMDELLVLDRESSLNDWEGEWVLVAAYITTDFAEEYDVEQSGLLAVPENAATLTITALKDATANDKVLGTMVDVASYIHDHTYDLSGELTFSDEDSYTVKSAWDEWANNVIAKVDYDPAASYNRGPAKTHVKGDDDTVRFADMTGVEIEDMETMKYIGMTTSGYLVLCYSDDNLAKKDGDMGVGYIFARVEAE